MRREVVRACGEPDVMSTLQEQEAWRGRGREGRAAGAEEEEEVV